MLDEATHEPLQSCQDSLGMVRTGNARACTRFALGLGSSRQEKPYDCGYSVRWLYGRHKIAADETCIVAGAARGHYAAATAFGVDGMLSWYGITSLGAASRYAVDTLWTRFVANI
jgi:hypothetical protein